MTSLDNLSPLYIWAGGKKKMIPKYQQFPTIPLEGYSTFVEPFFGGGAMTIWIAQNNPNVERFVINDVKSELMGIYHAIKSDVDSFISIVDTHQTAYLPLSKEDRKKYYYDLRLEYISDWRKWNDTENAGTLYFLMRTGFNGIWQVNQANNPDGRYTTPCGLLNQTSSIYDVSLVRLWHDFLQRVEIYSQDWQDVCTYDDAFYFFDPPYRESFTTYGAEFDDDEHIRLLDFCRAADDRGNLVFYCNRDDAQDDFFTKYRGVLSAHHYDVTYTAGRRKKENEGYSAKKAQEILIYSPALQPEETVFDSLFDVDN